MNLEEIRNPILRGLLLQYTGYEFPDKVISSIRMLIFPWDTLSLRVCLHCGRTIRIKGIMALPGFRLLAYCGACGCSKHRHKTYQELLDSFAMPHDKTEGEE